ncbi:hypothetical protein F2Q68_00024551 [Brassica cretica]|uniref:Uncharacterized protein n=1 Tax=Brassica cretica TaxID=69181 RepID=A0A8S9I668_BRACR|nr:hypothetical protein F2Q68_00024551 [Brassica cretica]
MIQLLFIQRENKKYSAAEEHDIDEKAITTENPEDVVVAFAEAAKMDRVKRGDNVYCMAYAMGRITYMLKTSSQRDGSRTPSKFTADIDEKAITTENPEDVVVAFAEAAKVFSHLIKKQ